MRFSADTSGWANYFVRTEPFHQDAKGLMQQWYKDQTRVITTNYILSGLVALFISLLRIPRPKDFSRDIRNASPPISIR